MHIIIIGGGRIGLPLGETLALHKHDVVIIEEDKDKCQEIADDFNGVVICGDATSIDVLKEAKAEKADFFVAVTSSEEANLLSCLLAKEVCSAKTLARVINPSYEKVFRKVGIDIVMSTDVALATRLEALIIEPDVVDIAMIHRGSIEMLEFKIGEKSWACGKLVRNLEKPKGAIIVAVKEGDEFRIPDLDTVLKAGDYVIVTVKKDFERQIRKMFAE